MLALTFLSCINKGCMYVWLCVCLFLNGVNSPIGSKILADSFKTDRLVARRASAYSRAQTGHYEIRLELHPKKSRVSSAIVLFPVRILLTQ